MAVVDAGVSVGKIQPLGANIDLFDVDLNTPQTLQDVQNANLSIFRMPGGSQSDISHFTDPPMFPGAGTTGSLATFIASAQGSGVVTLNYGTGSPQEAAAYLAYLDGATNNNTYLGYGEQWDAQTNKWVEKNWMTAGYWASLRAATPLKVDDGLNFLRLGHAAPFNFHYFEVGNEVYGDWETDEHGQGGDKGTAHDPKTYVTFAKTFASYAARIDSSISIGLDTGSIGENNDWTPKMLQQCASQHFVPGFLSDHLYVQSPGQENDANLLAASTAAQQDPLNPDDWVVRADDYRSLLTQYLGSAGNNVQLLATEIGSVSSDPGKQSISLVDGLFLADSLARLRESGYTAGIVWSLRDQYSTTGNDSSSLYGWSNDLRSGGDYGLLGDPTQTSLPTTGAYVPYPSYFAMQLLGKMGQTGSVIDATGDNPDLLVYATKNSNGHVELLVINTDPVNDLTDQIQMENFVPNPNVQVWQYGKAQDTAQSLSSDGQSALANFTATLTTSGSAFSYTFPSYSMTVLDLSPSTTAKPPAITSPMGATPAQVQGTTAALHVLAAGSNLTYSWSVLGSPAAAVAFSANNSTTAANTTATFAKAGTYLFEVTITDANGDSSASHVTVVVVPTLTTVSVTPNTSTVAPKKTQQLTATALDQFGNPLAAQPTIHWSVKTGKGSVGSKGLFTTPSTAGLSMLEATTGKIVGMASVTTT